MIILGLRQFKTISGPSATAWTAWAAGRSGPRGGGPKLSYSGKITKLYINRDLTLFHFSEKKQNIEIQTINYGLINR